MTKCDVCVQVGLENNNSCGSWTNWMSRAPLRLLGELHYGNSQPGLLGSLLEHYGPSSPLRATMLRCACKLVLLTRLREPSAWYRSFWDWAGVARKQQRNSSEFGNNLVEFAAAYKNLQSMLFLGKINRGLEAQYLGARINTGGLDKYRCFEHSARGGHQPHSKLSAADCNEGLPARVDELRVALRAFDVVGLVERFDETLLLVADLSGLQHVHRRQHFILTSSLPQPCMPSIYNAPFLLNQTINRCFIKRPTWRARKKRLLLGTWAANGRPTAVHKSKLRLPSTR